MKFRYVILAINALANLTAQETRSTISGHIYDPTGTSVAAAKVEIVNVDTNLGGHQTTSSTGYYEAPLLLPGNYKVTVVAQGFKKEIRNGVVLAVGTQIQIDLKLALGQVTETVQVTAEAPILDTNSVEGGSLIDNKMLMDMPVMGNNPILLTKLMAGIQTDGVNNYLGLHSIAGGSSYNNAAGVGGNEWSIDGTPNNGGSRRAAYLPYSDTIAEFRVDTTGVDPAEGRGTGVGIKALTKSGSNQYHGTLTEQHWQQRINATPYFTRQLYFKNIAAARASGNDALADKLAAQPRQPSGHSNNFAGTMGGPVVIPRLYNGRNKLFSFFSYNGFKDVKTEDPSTFNRTVPTMANRAGDFSQLLLVDASRYSVYDPLTVRRDLNRVGTFWIRDSFPGNIIPKARFINPMYDTYAKFYPVPNNDPTDPRQEPRNNYLSVGTPYNWSYNALSQRVDYNFSEKHRFFFRWSWNNFIEDRGDWTYESARGLNSNGLNRKNMGATFDWTWTLNSRTLLDVSLAANEFTEGNQQPNPMKYKPSDVGLPKYLDEWAGDQHILPQITATGYSTVSPAGVPSFTRYRLYSLKADLSQLYGKHSLHYGVDTRMHFRTGGGGGNTSGNFAFGNTYTRRNSDTLVVPGDLGLTWASVILGIPNSMSVTAGNANYATFSPYYGGFFNDKWNVTRKLSVSMGIRLEYEGGPTERFNRMIGYYDPSVKNFLTDTAERLYALNPIAERPVSTFKALGGVTFPGVNDISRNSFQGQSMFMPRLALAYAVDKKTVIRVSAGTFYDTLNVTNNSPNQTGFNRTTTNSSIANNAGEVWINSDPARGIPPVADPFPLRSNGTRFDTSSNGQLGVDTQNGRGFTFIGFGTGRARQQRWRAGIQRQIGNTGVISVTYAGSYSDNVNLTLDLNPVPGQYWSSGNTRNSTAASFLNSGITNPFRITNFPALARDNPALYQDMNSQGFFTNSNVSRAQLLKEFPQMTGLSQSMTPLGRVRTNGIEASYNRRFSKGYTYMLTYTGTQARTADWFPNAYMRNPAWREGNNARPHRFTALGTYQLPFGKGKRFLKEGWGRKILGGMQIAGTFEWQPGPLLDWGNIFYYGDINTIKSDNSTFDTWFNSAGTTCAQTPTANSGFERCANRNPDSYQNRTFPSRLPGVRKDFTMQSNANLQKEIPLVKERIKLFARVDILNAFNRNQFDSPSTDPTNTNFGRITLQTAAVNRFLQFQLRIQF